MSFPISNAAMIRGAAQLAGEVAARVGEALGFDEVLQGTAADKPSEEKLEAMFKKLTDALRDRLHQPGAGVSVNQPLEIRVTEGGKFQVEGDHPHAARIEALLNADEKLVAAAQQLAQAGGPTEFTVDPARSGAGTTNGLTSGRVPGNILNAPGGYPNW